MSGRDRRAGMTMQYEDNLLYCLGCKEQPEYFHEVMSWQVNRVRSDGTEIKMKDGEVNEYLCPECHGPAEWGHELRARGARASG